MPTSPGSGPTAPTSSSARSNARASKPGRRAPAAAAKAAKAAAAGPPVAYATVAFVDAALAHLDRVFTYGVPADAGADVVVGSVVRATVRGKRRTAVVVSVSDAPDVERVVPIAGTLGPGLPPDVVDLARWCAERYLSTLGEALASALPDRVASEETKDPAARTRTADAARTDAPPLPDELRAFASALDRGVAPAAVWRPSFDADRARAIVRLVERALAAGRGALVLVPETAVAGTVERALAERFGPALARLGSDRPPRERYAGWLAARRGDVRVVVGGRSAVFAPVQDLGLLVVDDEAHAAYKEGRAPRFHARAVAAERARRAKAAILLTGVPPSVEARAACERAPFRFLAPARPAERKTRPPVTVVDGDSRLVPAARTLALARETLDANRRVVVVAHRAERLDAVCERVERVTKARNLARLDHTSTRAQLQRALASADVIVATPFIAKDLLIDRVGLVAFVEADAALSQPEFRAAEETFATWWRAARSLRGGGAIAIESRLPNHPAVVALTRFDPDVLYRSEAARRRDLGYPPFAFLARIDVPPELAQRAARELDGVEVLGPTERDGRTVIVARARRRDELLRALAPVAARWRAENEPMRIDVDPWEVFVPKWRS
jgi:primosomal protein N' (replication factor Y)